MRNLVNLFVFSLACCVPDLCSAQSTIFTYQGRLSVNGTPANGLFDFQFTIYKVETNGAIIAGPMTNSAVAVSGGLFTVPLDFGHEPFLGVNRFLDIAVRANGSATAFTTVGPRVRIASAPYAIAAINVIDGAITASSLSPGPGADGQVLKMNGGLLTWGSGNGSGSVFSVGTGTGLLGGPITTSGTISLDSSLVPLLSGNQIFTGSNTFNGVSSLANANNKFAGAFFGNGAGLSNIVATATNGSVILAGDVTGSSTAATVARIRNANVLATAPSANQVLRFNGTDWAPAPVALGTDVTGTLLDARLSANVPLLNGNQTFTGSNTFNGVSSLTNLNNKFAGTFSGNGASLTTLNAANVSSGALPDARLSANVPLLNGNQTFTGSNTFNGVSSLANPNNKFAGAFFGNGAGLSNIVATATNSSVTLAGDVTGLSTAATVARIRNANVLAIAPSANQLLRFNGTDWAPAPVALGTDVTGTLLDTRLSANVPLLNGNQTFTGSNTFNGVSSLTNVNNKFAGTFSGNGASLTTLNAANVSSGALPDARLSANVPLLNGNQTFTGSNTFNGVSSLANANNKFAGAFFGNGAGLSNIVATATNGSVTLAGDVTGLSTAATVARIRNANVLATAPSANQVLRFNGTDWAPAPVALGTDVTGTLLDARLSANVPLLNGNQTFTGSNTFNGVSSLTNLNNKFAGSFSGNGASLTTLNAANVSSGALPDARLSANVPLLNGNQTFTGSNTFNGVSSLANPNNKFAGAFFGNGAGLSNIVATATNGSVILAGDVTGSSTAATVARIRNANVLPTAPSANQVLRFNGTDWAPAPVALGTDVTGTLLDARLSANVPLLNGNQTFTGSNTFNGVSSLTNANNKFAGSFSGNGASLTTLNAANVSSGALPDARLSANVPLLNGNQTFTGSNTFNGVSSLANANNKFAGAFFGNGAGLSNIVATATNGSVTLAGDVIGSSSAATVARIRNVTVASNAPIANQLLRYNGTAWTPGAVTLGTDVSGALPVINGGTGAASPGGARASLGAASSGANSDITSLGGLTTPLSATQGGSGQAAYNTGDLLYASAANVLSRRPIGTSAQVLSVSNALPVWSDANNHDHFGQIWSGVAADGLFLQNTSVVAGASALTASSWATNDISYGVFGQTASSEGIGVEGFAFATSGLSTGVFGESTSTNGTGVYGFGSASSGQPIGVYGESDAPSGIGIYGIGAATNGTPVGVYGTVSTAGGYGLYTPNRLYVGESATIIGALNVSSLTVNNTNRVTNLNADLVDGLNSAQFLRSDASSTLTAGSLTFAFGTRLFSAAGSAGAPSISFSSSTIAGFYSPAANTLGLSTSGTERLRIAADGKIGIGRSATTNILEVEGNASKTAAGSWLANSDARIKTGVEKLEHALETIDQVRPVSFHYTDEYRAAHPSLEDKKYCNVIAQEFAKVFPEAVKESGETLDGKPILQVDVHPAAVYAIAAIQELHELVKVKDREVSKLKEQNETLEKRLQLLEKAVNGLAR